MYILWSLLLGASLAIDAFAVSVSNSICYKLSVKKMIFIAGMFAIFQGLMPAIGYTFSELLKNIEWFKNIIPIIGCCALLFLGIKTIIEAIKSRNEGLECSTKPISIKLIIFQGIATAIDALIVGIGLDNTISATSNVEVMIGIFIIVAITFLICYIGLLLGKMIGSKMKSNAEIFGGIILIGIAVKILIEFLIEINS